MSRLIAMLAFRAQCALERDVLIHSWNLDGRHHSGLEFTWEQ